MEIDVQVERAAATAMMRRARKAGAATIEMVWRLDVFTRDNWTCHLCGNLIPEDSRGRPSLTGKRDPLAPVVDHVIPLATGGDHTMANCKAAHANCNNRKGKNSHLPVPKAKVVIATSGTEELCGVTGCPRAISGRFSKVMCHPHHRRVKKTGDPLKKSCQCGCGQLIAVEPDNFSPVWVEGHARGGTLVLTLEDQLRANIAFRPVTEHGRSIGLTDDCHIWTGKLHESGYGSVEYRLARNKRKTRLVHRANYELVHGDIAELVVDHLCRERACFNVNHLEAVTHADNLRRGAAARTTCPNGHLYTEDNIRAGQAGRACKQCHRDRERIRRLRAKSTVA